MAAHLPKSGPVVGGVLLVAGLVGAQLVLGATSALAIPAVTTLNVSTTSDIAANAGACGNAAITTPPNPLSLREATCIANNVGGTVTINVPSGTYTLSHGELDLGIASGQNITIAGAGAATTTITAAGASRVLDFDQNLVGGIAASISGVTITGGADSTFGGAGIIAGSGFATTIDTLDISNSTITGNQANAAAPNVTNNPGGGVQFIGGALSIENSTISNNGSKSSPGSGVAYSVVGTASGQSLTISGTTFSGNAATNTNGTTLSNGGALDVSGSPTTTYSVTGSTFANNTVVGSSPGSAVGAGIREESGALTVTGSTFTGNSVSGGVSPSGGAIQVMTGTATVQYDRFAGNTAPTGSAITAGGGAGAVTATENWFGCNGAPNAAGCDTIAGTMTTSPHLSLTGAADPSSVNSPNGTSTVTVGLLVDSAGSSVDPSNLGAFAGLPISWSNPTPSGATINNGSTASTDLSSGTASVTYNSQNTVGAGGVTAALDNGSITVPISVSAPPQIVTDPQSQTVPPNSSVTFTASASGFPTPTVQWQVSTNNGGSFSDITNATSTTYTHTALSTENNNEYQAVFTNSVGHATTTAATLNVGAAPDITSADNTDFPVGSFGTFTVTTDGSPTPAISETGSLPNWLSLIDNGDGTATLSGTPPTGSEQTYAFTLEAANGFSPAASQIFTLTVDAAPSITSGDSTTFTVGEDGTFTVTTNPGFPTTTSLSETGALPGGVTFTDNGDGTATLAGTPADGTSGPYPFTVTADNGQDSSTQSFTLTVDEQSQTINVISTPPNPAVVGGSYPLDATASSNLTVAFSIDPATTNSACSLNVSTVEFDQVGSCVVDFDQPGDGTFAPAQQLKQTFSIGLVATQVGVTTTPTATSFGQPVTATATITADSGTPAGNVQFEVDGNDLGTPVPVSSGTATSGPLTDTSGNPLDAASYSITAVFAPTDTTTYDGSQSSVSLVVSKADTTATVTVNASSVSSTVAAVSPGAGTPTGTVTFTVNGNPLGTASLSGGVATLNKKVPSAKTAHVAASYGGDGDFNGSSASTSRQNPTITAKVTSAHAKTHFGWYRSPVTVTFHCTTNGAPLTGPCPAAVTLSHNGGAQSVTRTVTATDGGAATVVVSPINIDRTPPKVRVSGVRNGATYNGVVPVAHCVATDPLSGVASCHLTLHTSGITTTYTATASDRAGNKATVTGHYRTLGISIEGASFSAGAFNVKAGATYTLVVHGSSRPTYYDAAPFPTKPFKRDPHVFSAAGHDRWTIGVTMVVLDSHKYWNIGVKIGHTMHVIKLRVTS